MCKLIDFEKWVTRKKENLEEGKAKLYTEVQKPKGKKKKTEEEIVPGTIIEFKQL